MADLHPELHLIVEQLRDRGQLKIILDNQIPSEIYASHRTALKRFSRSLTALEKTASIPHKNQWVRKIQAQTLLELHEAGLLLVNFVLQTAVDDGLLPNPDTNWVALKNNGGYTCWDCGAELEVVDLPPFAAREADIHKFPVICPACGYGG